MERQTKTEGAVKAGSGRYDFAMADLDIVPAGTGYSTSEGGVVEGEPEADGYWVRREVYYLGRQMRWGGLGRDWVVRLFLRERGRCTPAPVHTAVQVDGVIGRLRGTIEHHTARTVLEHLSKVERYGAVRTAQLAGRGRRYRATDWLRIPVEIFAHAFLRLGVLDGARGIVWATVSAYGKWLRCAMLINRPPQRPGSDLAGGERPR